MLIVPPGETNSWYWAMLVNASAVQLAKWDAPALD
jgi:hypothetical protein